MILTNFWWLIVWTIIGGLLLNYLSPKERITVLGKEKNTWTPFATYIFITPLIIWGGFRKNFGDTEHYRKTFHEIGGSLSQFGEFYDGLNKDKFFYSLEYLFKVFFGDNDILFFLLLALFQIVIISNLFRKYSTNYWLSMFIFIASTDYLSWVFNGVRQFLAVTMIYAATSCILKKQFIRVLIIILIASRFHGSALLMIPVVFIIQGRVLNRKTIFSTLLSVVLLVYIGSFTSILETLLADTQYTNVVSDWQSFNDDGMNPIRALIFSVPSILVFLGIKNIRYENDPVINMAANASLITTAISIVAVGTSGIFIGRLPIYTGVYAYGILLPWAIDHIFTEQSAKMIKAIAVVAYCLFFYYQMHFTWGII